MQETVVRSTTVEQLDELGDSGASREIEAEWVRLQDALAGKTMRDLRIHVSTGASIVAVIRGEEVMPNPGPVVALRAGDLVGVLGTPDQRAAFRALTDGP